MAERFMALWWPNHVEKPTGEKREVVLASDYDAQINLARDILSRAVMHFYERDDYNDEVHGPLRRDIDRFLEATGGLPEAFSRLVPKR